MIDICNVKDLDKLIDNRIIGNLNLENSRIRFIGKNNILYLDGNVKLKDTSFEFRGDNSIMYLCESGDVLSLDIKIYNNSVFFFGFDNWINRSVKIVVSEECNVIIGNDNLISYDTCIRTADPHIIYDIKSKKRINQSKSIFIGDHTWIGQHVLILKGAMIGSGSIFGAMTLVTNKKYKSNKVYGGNPAKIIKDDAFFLKDAVHNFTNKEKEKYSLCDSDKYIYEKDKHTISFIDIDKKLVGIDVNKKIKFLKNNLIEKNFKNRFYI